MISVNHRTTPNPNIYSSSAHWRCRWVCFLIRFGESLAQWMGAVRMRLQTANKNITIINTTPVNHLMTCEVIRCLFVRNFKRSYLAKNWKFTDVFVENRCIVFACKRCFICAYFSPDSGKMMFHWKKQYHAWNHADFHFTKCQLMDWSGVDYLWIIMMFLSAVWTLFAPIHCRGSSGDQVM